MFGEPEDVDGECNARLYIGDNYGDNTATMRCRREPGHEGLHQEQFEREGPVTITWTTDERKRCDHGCGQWKHEEDPDETFEGPVCPKNAVDHEYESCRFCHDGRDPHICEHCAKPYYGSRHWRCPSRPKDPDEVAFASASSSDQDEFSAD